MGLAEAHQDVSRLGDKFEQLKVGKRPEHVDGGSKPAAQQNQNFLASGGRPGNKMDTAVVADSLACKRVDGILLVSDDLKVATL